MKLILLLISISISFSTQINPERIRKSKSEYLIHTRRGEKLVYMTLLTREIDHVRFNNRDCLRIVQIYEKTDGADYDTCYVDITTLKPVAYRALVYGHQRETFDFKNGRMSGRVFWPDSIDTQFDDPLPDATYNSVMSLEILQALDFESQSSYRFDMFNPGKGGIFAFEYQLTGEKTVEFNGVRINCLIIDGKSFFNDKERTAGTYYLEKGTGRLVKHIYPFPNNAGLYTKTRIL
ncbi:MAG: hypothetical protein KDD94_00655 [Calditrichaeota bacterium]|nr:hypothetical protein [Calditrichota bacterium]